MARFKKLSLDEARETFTLLSEAEQRAIKGGCSKCEEARSYGYNVYTQGEFEQMLDAGTWTGGYVCGMGMIGMSVTIEGEYGDSYSHGYGKPCFLHNKYYPLNGSCPDCDALYEEISYGDSGYGDSYSGGDNYGSFIGGGGGGSGFSSIELMNSSKFVSEKTTKNCLTASKKILEKYGLTSYGSSSHVYQLLIEENKTLQKYRTDHVTTFKNAMACIDRHLAANRPIIVGTHHTFNYGVNEGTTDHFVVITGRGYDSEQQKYYYTYMETGREESAAGCNTKENRFYYDEKTQTLTDDLTYRTDKDGNHKSLTVTQVRPNDGKNLNETIVQPAKP